MPACPTCGKELTYVRMYDRWYCSYEEKYVPKGYGTATGAEPGVGPYCPSCGRELLYIREYDRYYCREERKYARKGLTRRPP